MKKSLMESTGEAWFNRRVAGAWFMHEGKLLLLRRGDEGIIKCEDRIERKQVYLPTEVISGFGKLQYPKLGYRRNEKTGTVGFMHKHHTFDRGLRPVHIKAEATPGFAAIGRRFEFEGNDELMKAVFMPVFDKEDSIKEMLANDRFAVVMNSDVMIEPSVADDGDDFTVYYRKRPAGHINVKGKVHWRTDGYRDLLMPMFKNSLKV